MTNSQKNDCLDHLDFVNEFCPDCGLAVNEYGNTENRLQYCQFSGGHCGCDGARNCMAENGAVDFALKNNRENMWSNGSKKENLEAVGNCMKAWLK